MYAVNVLCVTAKLELGVTVGRNVVVHSASQYSLY